jgi:hypothetical protein
MKIYKKIKIDLLNIYKKTNRLLRCWQVLFMSTHNGPYICLRATDDPSGLTFHFKLLLRASDLITASWFDLKVVSAVIIIF